MLFYFRIKAKIGPKSQRACEAAGVSEGQRGCAVSACDCTHKGDASAEQSPLEKLAGFVVRVTQELSASLEPC